MKVFFIVLIYSPTTIHNLGTPLVGAVIPSISASIDKWQIASMLILPIQVWIEVFLWAAAFMEKILRIGYRVNPLQGHFEGSVRKISRVHEIMTNGVFLFTENDFHNFSVKKNMVELIMALNWTNSKVVQLNVWIFYINKND